MIAESNNITTAATSLRANQYTTTTSIAIDSDFLDEILEDCGFYELCGLLESERDEDEINSAPTDSTYLAEEIYDINLCCTSPDWFLSYWQQYDKDE